MRSINLKKATVFIAIVLFTLCIMPDSKAMAENITQLKTEDGLTYELDPLTKTATVKDYDMISENLVIPGKVEEYTVTKIAESACVLNVEEMGDGVIGLRHVTIPANVQSIENGAFKDCKNLLSVTFEEGSRLTTIGDKVFSNCDSLREILLPKSVEQIGNAAFYQCGELINFTFEEGSRLKAIGGLAFCETGLRSMVIPQSVTEVGKGSFQKSPYIEYLYYPETVTAMMEATLIMETCMQVSYTETGDGKIRVKVMTLPENMTKMILPAQIFGKSIGTVTYAEGIDGTKIETVYTSHMHTFTNGNTACECGYIPVTIQKQPENVTIKTITHKKSKGIYRVTGVDKNKGTVEYVKPQKKNAKKVTIPASIKAGGVTYKVTGIAENAFQNNRKVKHITIKTRHLALENVGNNAFAGISSKATIKVPKKKLTAYKKILKAKGIQKGVKIKK